MKMNYASCMIYSDDVAPLDTQLYETAFDTLSFGEKIEDCQLFSDIGDEAATAKLLILYIKGGSDIAHEVKRVFAWKRKREKADFLTGQLQSRDRTVLMAAVDLLGILREMYVVPQLDAIFDIKDPALARRIIDAFSEIGENAGVATIMKALVSGDRDLLLLAVGRLARMIDAVPWKLFRPLLLHEEAEVRSEAAFAICIRKSHQSAGCMLGAIGREKDRATRLLMIKYASMLPSARLLRPLLMVTVHDPDQKARLAASRTLDRLQGLLHPGAIFRMRGAADMAIRAEVLFRLGKFGSEIERHKDYLRETLKKGTDLTITQACLQALGSIAERVDIDLLMEYLYKEPFTSYNAAIALTKIFRLEDKGKALDILKRVPSNMIKQIFLRYLSRRRGLGAGAHELLESVKSCIEGEENINVRYLAFGLLEYAPSVETLEFLLASHGRAASAFEKEAIDIALRGLALHHGDDFLALVHSCDESICAAVIRYLPVNMSGSFYRSLAKRLYERYNGPLSGGVDVLFRDIFEHLMTVPQAIREFVRPLPDASWRVFFLHVMTEHADLGIIKSLEDELIEMLSDDDHEVRALAMMLILSLKDAAVVPRLISIAERDPRSKLRKAAGYIARTLVKEGIL